MLQISGGVSLRIRVRAESARVRADVRSLRGATKLIARFSHVRPAPQLDYGNWTGGSLIGPRLT